MSAFLARRVPAFTLVETLIVVAIVGLLAAISLPTLGAARARGRLVRCAASLRQIGVGLTSYRLSNRDVLPVNGWEPWKDAWAGFQGFQMLSGRTWVRALQESMGIREPPWLRLLRCPQALSRYDVPSEIPVQQDGFGSAWILNSYCLGRMLSSIPAPSDGVMVFESGLWSQMSNDTGRLELPTMPYCYPHPGVIAETVSVRWSWAYRGQKRNILWCDGHVAAFDAAHWPDGDEVFDAARIRHMRFGLPGNHPLDP